MPETELSEYKPDAIVFDLSEVYIRGLLGTHDLVSEHLGVDVRKTAFKGDALTKLFHGEISEADYWQTTIRHNNWDVSVADLEALVRSNFGRIEGTDEIIRELRAKNYALGLLSVHAKEWVAYCEEMFQYRELFDVVMYSFEHGVSKPEPRAFELVLEAMGVPAENTMFVDDSMENIRTARGIGMRAVLFSSASQLRVELVKSNIL